MRKIKDIFFLIVIANFLLIVIVGCTSNYEDKLLAYNNFILNYCEGMQEQYFILTNEIPAIDPYEITFEEGFEDNLIMISARENMNNLADKMINHSKVPREMKEIHSEYVKGAEKFKNGIDIITKFFNPKKLEKNEENEDMYYVNIKMIGGGEYKQSFALVGIFRKGMEFLSDAIEYTNSAGEVLKIQTKISPAKIEIVSTQKRNEVSESSTVNEKLEKWEDKLGGYLGTDEFGKDLNEMSDEIYTNAKDKGGYTRDEEEIWKYCMDRWDYYDRKKESDVV